jgi:hypothetical protein
MALPPPIDGTETYLAAIHDRLGELLDRLPQPAAGQGTEGGQVELREPVRPEPAQVEVSEPKRPTSTEAGSGVSQRPARPARTTTRTKKGA